MAEMAAQYCTTRIVKRRGGSVVAKNMREARVRGHELPKLIAKTSIFQIQFVAEHYGPSFSYILCDLILVNNTNLDLISHPLRYIAELNFSLLTAGASR